MRLFQNVITYPNFRPILAERNRSATSYAERMRNFIDSCFINLHILKPVLDGSEDAFLASGDDMASQRVWADEHGLPKSATEADILLAQIEEHRSEVIYNWDPSRFDNGFLKRLPGHVKKRIAWHASPVPNLRFEDYDRIVCNFPGLIRKFEEMGFRSAWFAPAHDPIMDEYADNSERPFDVIFVGGYSRHHLQRISVLKEVATAHPRLKIGYFLDTSIYGRLADSPFGIFWPLNKVRRPKVIRTVARRPVFGREMYQTISKAKIVLNGAIDMAGDDRGNLRCWEAMGLGSMMVSDAGVYPPHMQAGEHFAQYESPESALSLIERAISTGAWKTCADAGRQMIRSRYSKEQQWRNFLNLL